LGNPAGGSFGYTVEYLMYLLTISVPFGGLRDVDVKAGEKVIITPATALLGVRRWWQGCPWELELLPWAAIRKPWGG
jgi:hypothetical protein